MDFKVKALIFLILTIIGIFILFLISNISLKQVSISEINQKMINHQVQITAKVISTRFFKDSSFQTLILQDKTGNITGTLFTDKKLFLNTTKTYTIKGKVTSYKNETQITINKISEKS